MYLKMHTAFSYQLISAASVSIKYTYYQTVKF